MMGKSSDQRIGWVNQRRALIVDGLVMCFDKLGEKFGSVANGEGNRSLTSGSSTEEAYDYVVLRPERPR
jgi:hypothetical protein